MKDRMASFLVLPFSIHSTTHSSTTDDDDVAITQSKKPHLGSNALLTRRKEVNKKMKRSWGFLALGRCFISRGIQKLINTLKSFSQLFVYKEEKMEEEEIEMEIGFPTDVKHVTHIGLDGFMTTNVKEKAPKSISLSQFELAMAAQATTHVLAF